MARLLLILFCTSALQAQDFSLSKTIPQEVWDIREDPEQNIRDAVTVRSVLRVNENRIHHYLMMRILSEYGKGALQTMVLNDNLTKMAGQVVDASGVVTHFDKKADLMRLLAVRAGNRKKSTVVLLPPGLTPNCVVEVVWSEKAENGLPLKSMHSYYPVGEAVYCMEKVFEVSTALASFKSQKISKSYVEMSTRMMWTPISAPAILETKVFDGFTNVTYRNVPAMEQQPFGVPASDSQGAVVQVFRTIQYAGLETKYFWRNFSQVWIKASYGEYYYKDGAYGAWLAEILKALPARDADGAQMLFNAFKRRFTRADMMTHKQRNEMKTAKLEFNSRQTSDLINLLATKGYVHPSNMSLVFYRVMVDCGFKPKLIFARANAAIPFEPESLNPFLLDVENPAVGIQDREGRWYTFAPAHAEYDIGHLPDTFRNQSVLVVDPADNWDSSFMTLSRPSWKLNRLLQSYTLKLEPNGLLFFSMNDRNQGIFNAEIRGATHYMNPDEQAELLLAYWQDNLPEWQLGSTVVKGVDDYTEKIKTSIKGVCQMNLNNSTWLELDPFPGSQPLLEIPRIWPEKRSQPIVLQDNRGHISRCRLTLPPNWSVVNPISWTRENKIGKVSFSVQRKKGQWEAERQMIIKDSTLSADEDPLLRAFTSWVSDAMDQRIAIAPEGAL